MIKAMIKLMLLNFLILNSMHVFSRNYYVNPSSLSRDSDGSVENPWRTIEEVTAASIYMLPGDSVFFKRSNTYNGRLNIRCSGSQYAPIVFTSYGSGDMPVFNNHFRDIITLYNREYIVIDGFHITDTAQIEFPKNIPAKMSYAIIIDNSLNCTVKNCIISNAGIGIELKEGSNYTNIIKNKFYDLRMVINSEGGDDDFGATPVVVSSSYNNIKHNIFENCWANSYDYQFEGGAVQLFGSNVRDNIIMYNTALNCNGFLKTGSSSNGLIQNNIVAYNKIINCGRIAFLLNDGKFAVTVDSLKFYNNVVVETSIQLSGYKSLFSSTKQINVDALIIKNNIFWISTGTAMYSATINPDTVLHTNNIYRGFDMQNYVLHKSEKVILSDTIFRSIVGEPSQWNYSLHKTSAAIDFGEDVGFETDFIGSGIINKPEAGLFEYINPIIHFNLDTIKCNGDSARLQISATNGLPPYSGIGTFIVTTGTYNYIVQDANRNSDSIEITINEPPSIQLDAFYSPIDRYGGKTSLQLKASGGTPPYFYSLNDANPSNTNLFNGLPSGEYTITVIDTNGCTFTKRQLIESFRPTLFIDSKIDDFKVFPNPSSTSFTLNNRNYSSKDKKIELNVFDSHGLLLISRSGDFDELFQFGDQLPTGYYSVQIRIGEKYKTLTIVKH